VAHFVEAADVDSPNGRQPLCSACCTQKKKGSFCPLCLKSYDDNDYDTRMVECSKCGGWVHGRCESMNEEKYQILSYLPDSVEFVCK
jgi:histone-lysine N-methyltransferase MLL1